MANSELGTQHKWEEVFAAYSDARVVLTVHPRGAEAWYESTLDSVYFTEQMWQFKLLEYTTPVGRKFGDRSRKLIWQRSHQDTMPEWDRAIAHYYQHIDEVKDTVPTERLLIFSVDQGWQPLCEFLGLHVPENAFPNVNDRAAIKKTLSEMTRGAYVILGAAALAVTGVVYTIIRVLN